MKPNSSPIVKNSPRIQSLSELFYKCNNNPKKTSNYNVTANRLNIDISVTNLDDNPFGQVLSGSLILRGLVHGLKGLLKSWDWYFSLAGCLGIPTETENIKCLAALRLLSEKQ